MTVGASEVTQDDRWLAEQFETNRGHLRAVAYRMLGSLDEADDAVQEAWLRLSRSDSNRISNPAGWLTTVVGRICLDMLRARRSRREEPYGPHLPEPILSRAEGVDPESQVLLADSVGLALLVVLETLGPAERLAFVLHDMFGLPFEEIAPIVDRTPAAARKLASRARQRVRGAPIVPDPDLARQREVVEAFQAAGRDGDFEALLSVLDPDVVLRADGGVPPAAGSREIHGATEVAQAAARYAHLSEFARPVLVNGTPGFLVAPHGKPFAVLGFTVVGGRIVEIDILADADRLQQLDLAGLDD